ncbi:parkin coregulated gene protein homolog [Pararge aegeria]|uniref:Jg15834 protein n=1 Tax=Pararge aegeria aegeria TaxID=348720 RepID=A0A8S4SGZ7_9NEOP|nr:parkin coregulated gene protein homolog [Pararge aegeria]XP_039751523.1 parkin coregulated gene protein homolog [Pararge aegeria]XP_039751524.1 parkin coregulated gene protein homolog [Pararge aegeria]XP_039751525.1 parkin coregulated gene protein homolog [Pararge aegeria]CAH2268380.1 jg15834 [Pararge aegeria aegeria]
MVLLPPCAPNICGKDFRSSLKKPSPIYPYASKTRKCRSVPAFTIQAMQKNTKVIPPPKSGVYDPLPVKPTMFRKCYQRGEFPVAIEFTTSGKQLSWKVPIEKLDFHHYLPMFFDGLAEGTYPFSFIVERGIHDLVSKGSYKILPVVPQLIIPIKNAFATKRPTVLCHTLKCIQMIVMNSDKVGEALVPYYRQILPILNLFKGRNRNLGAGIDNTTTRDENVADLIEDTLQILERHGGPDAFINIKYMIPTYESCVLN